MADSPVDTIDTILSYTVPTGRTAAWTFSGTVQIPLQAYYDHAGNGPWPCAGGPFGGGNPEFTAGATYGPRYAGIAEVGLCDGRGIFAAARIFEATCNGMPGGDPTHGNGFFVIVTNNDGSKTWVSAGSSVLSGPFNHPSIILNPDSVMYWYQVSVSFSITAQVREVMVGTGRAGVKYLWETTQVSTDVGGHADNYSTPTGIAIEPRGSWAFSVDNFNGPHILYTDYTGFSWDGITNEVDGWSIGGADAGGATSFAGPITSILSNTQKTIGGTTYSEVYTSAADAPISTNPADPGYNRAISGQVIVSPPAASLTVDCQEFHWDGSPYVRAGGDPVGAAIAANISASNTWLNTVVGSKVPVIPFANPHSANNFFGGGAGATAGYYALGSLVGWTAGGIDASGNYSFNPKAFPNPATVPPIQLSGMYVDSTGDPFMSLGRVLGYLTIFRNPVALSVGTLAATSGPGDIGINAVQVLAIGGGATGGTFPVAFNGQSHTFTYSVGLTAAAVQAGFVALSTVLAGNCTVTGPNGGPYTFTFIGGLGNQAVSLISTSAAGLTGGTPTAIVNPLILGQAPGNSTTLTAALGNWAAERFLQMDYVATLTANDHASLIVEQGDGTQSVYTLREDRFNPGTAIVDLAFPDGPTSPIFGMGPGLVTPALNYTDTINTPVAGDLASQITQTSVSKLTVSVPNANESVTISNLAFYNPTGVDAWTDNNGPHDRYAVGSGMYYTGRLTILSEGKPALRYPYIGLNETVGVPLQPTVQDFIDNLVTMVGGFTAAYTETFVVPGGGAQPASTNIPMGMVFGRPDPFGDTKYIPWSGGESPRFFAKRDLDSIIAFSPVSSHYNLVGRWVHDGGIEGIAYDYRSRQALNSGTFEIDQPPAAPLTAKTNAVGFYRSLNYNPTDLVTIPALQSVQTLVLSGANGGTWGVIYGLNSTSGIPWNASASQVSVALNGLSSISAEGSVLVFQPLPGVYVVVFSPEIQVPQAFRPFNDNRIGTGPTFHIYAPLSAYNPIERAYNYWPALVDGIRETPSTYFAPDVIKRPTFVGGDATEAVLMYTQDAGATWPTADLPASSYFPSLAIDRRTNTYLMASNNANGDTMTVYSNTQADGGGSWTVVGTLPCKNGVIAGEPGNERHLIAVAINTDSLEGSYSGLFLYQSYDGGATWNPTHPVKLETTGYAAVQGTPTINWLESVLFVIYAMGSDLIAQVSIDSGKTFSRSIIASSSVGWACVSSVWRNGLFYVLAYDSGLPSTPYLWSSGDIGQTWQAVPANLPQFDPSLISVGMGQWTNTGRMLISGIPLA